MALYNNSKDCSCVCKYISIIRHFSLYWSGNAGSARVLNSTGQGGGVCLRLDGMNVARPPGCHLASAFISVTVGFQLNNFYLVLFTFLIFFAEIFCFSFENFKLHVRSIFMMAGLKFLSNSSNI